MSNLRVVVAGASGRMGQSVIRTLSQDPEIVLCGAIIAKDRPELGREVAPGVRLTDDPLPALAKADALIDFSHPGASVSLAALAAQARIVHVIGTTGFSASDDTKIRAAARHAVIVKSGNMSLGVNLVAALVRQAAKALQDFDIEIVEMHHRLKRDAPSGTAILLGEAAAQGRSITLTDHAVRSRDGQTGSRPDGAIGFAALRGGTVVGEHTVVFAGPHERVVLGHVAEDRAIFAKGAIAAARWGHTRKPGLYEMADVLGLA